MQYVTKVEFVIKAKNFDSAQKKMEKVKTAIERTSQVQHLRMVGQVEK
jgi:hypothetical protein